MGYSVVSDHTDIGKALLSLLPYVFGLCPIYSQHLTALKLSRQAAACGLQAILLGIVI